MARQVREVPPARRGRGNRAGLDLVQIVAAARSMEPGEVTMQAVADRLGVDPKALNHHVGNRENLLRLLALDVFAENFSAVEIAAQSRWEDACRMYATGVVDSLIATGGLVEHLPQDDPIVPRSLASTEALLAKWIEAGWHIGTAQRALVLLTGICMTFARDVLQADQEAEAPRPRMLRE